MCVCMYKALETESFLMGILTIFNVLIRDDLRGILGHLSHRSGYLTKTKKIMTRMAYQSKKFYTGNYIR